jgi:hypothetical protein
MFIATFFMTGKRQKQPKCPSAEELGGSTHPVEYYSPIRMDKAVTQATTWTNPDNRLRESSRHKRSHLGRVHSARCPEQEHLWREKVD